MEVERWLLGVGKVVIWKWRVKCRWDTGCMEVEKGGCLELEKLCLGGGKVVEWKWRSGCLAVGG